MLTTKRALQSIRIYEIRRALRNQYNGVWDGPGGSSGQGHGMGGAPTGGGPTPSAATEVNSVQTDADGNHTISHTTEGGSNLTTKTDANFNRTSGPSMHPDSLADAKNMVAQGDAMDDSMKGVKY